MIADAAWDAHTEAIRKGKVAKPTEFGKLVTIQESEHQIITAYEVHDRRPADMTLWTPALDRHIAIFDRPPAIAAGDRGFASAKNEEAAIQRGVRRVILPRPGRTTPATRVRTAAMVPSRTALARRLRRAYQCDQTSAWLTALSLSRLRRHRALGGARRHCQ